MDSAIGCDGLRRHQDRQRLAAARPERAARTERARQVHVGECHPRSAVAACRPRRSRVAQDMGRGRPAQGSSHVRAGSATHLARPQAVWQERQPSLSRLIPRRKGVLAGWPRQGSGRHPAEHPALGHRTTRWQGQQAGHAGVVHRHGTAGRPARHRRHPRSELGERPERLRARETHRCPAGTRRRSALEASAGVSAGAIRRGIHFHRTPPQRTRLAVEQAARRPQSCGTARTEYATASGT